MMATKLELTAFANSDWHTDTVPNGAVYYNGDNDLQARAGVDLLHGLALGEVILDESQLLSDAGRTATVYKVGGMVVKVFDKPAQIVRSDMAVQTPEAHGNSGLPYLQASVGLYEGLKNGPEYLHGQDRVRFCAPRMYGLYRPSRLDGELHPVSVMEFSPGDGRETWAVEPPDRNVRREVYKTAIKAAGLPPSRVLVDEIGDNTLTHIDPDTGVHVVTRLDVVGRGNRLWPVTHHPTSRQRLHKALGHVGGFVFNI
jgi:hypothetical protein